MYNIVNNDYVLAQLPVNDMIIMLKEVSIQFINGDMAIKVFINNVEAIGKELTTRVEGEK